MHQTIRKNPSGRKVLDQYFTKIQVVRECLSHLEPTLYDLIIEPSAGNGAFYHAIEHPNKVGIDISPEDPDIIQADWLKYEVPSEYGAVLVVGNPPFGQYHALSSTFIAHALGFSNVQTVAFVLPNVYKKHTRQKIVPRDWRIKCILDLPANAFVLGEEDFHLPSSFFVIDRSKGRDLRARSLEELTMPEDFSFGHQNDHDIFVFGASPRRIIRHPQPNNRGYFLKAHIQVDDLIKKIRAVDWKGHSCASGGVYWLTKTEFLEQYISTHKKEKMNSSKIKINTKEILNDIKYILDNKEVYKKIKEKIYAIRGHLVSLVLEEEITEKEFYTLTEFLSSQSRAPLWEKYFIKKNEYTKVSRSKDKGDFEKMENATNTKPLV